MLFVSDYVDIYTKSDAPPHISYYFSVLTHVMFITGKSAILQTANGGKRKKMATNGGRTL